MKLKSSSLPWQVLNYIVSEPDEWTCRTIAEDIGKNQRKVSTAVRSLLSRGLIVKSKQLGPARSYIPTPDGVQTLYETI